MDTTEFKSLLDQTTLTLFEKGQAWKLYKEHNSNAAIAFAQNIEN